MARMKKWFAVRMLGAAIAVAGLAGCGTLSGTTEADSPDAQLASDVAERLQNDPITGRLNIGVTALEGVVTLGGNIPDDNARVRAKDIARGTDGVRGVVDEFFPRR